VSLRRLSGDGALVLAGGALILLWPLSAYSFSPALMPIVVLALGAGALVVKRPEYGIAIAVALVPFHRLAIGIEGGGFQPVKFLVPLMAVGLLAYGLIVIRDERPLQASALMVAIFGFLAVVLVSAIQGLEPSKSVGEILRVSTAAILFLATLQICRQVNQVWVVAGGAVAGLLGAALQGLAQQALGLFSQISLAVEGEEVGRIAGLFGHPNQYAGYLATLMPLAGALAMSRRVPSPLRWLSGSAFAAALPALNFAYTRGAILGLALGVLTWLLIMRRRGALVVAVAMLCVAVFAAPSVLRERFSDANSGEVALRTDLWGSALDIYAKRPLLGAGIDNFATAYATLPINPTFSTQRRLLHTREVIVPPHAANAYLTILAEQGLLGLLMFLALFVLALLTAYRVSRAEGLPVRAVGLGLGAGLLTFAFHNMLEVTLLDVIQPLLVLVAALAALGSAGEQQAGPADG
jgi:O-antigen ligase